MMMMFPYIFCVLTRKFRTKKFFFFFEMKQENDENNHSKEEEKKLNSTSYFWNFCSIWELDWIYSNLFSISLYILHIAWSLLLCMRFIYWNIFFLWNILETRFSKFLLKQNSMFINICVCFWFLLVWNLFIVIITFGRVDGH